MSSQTARSTPCTDDEEHWLKVKLMKADLGPKEQQSIWETPRNVVILVAAIAAIAFSLGFRLGQKDTPSPPPQIIFQPGSIVVAPAAPHSP